jgi:ribosomal protein S18 acetylase RimI-like enzyme
MPPVDLEPLLRFWRAQDAPFDRIEPTWWGAVVSDPRYPRIQEANYARVETEQAVRLAEVEVALVPSLARSGSTRTHVLVFRAQEQADLLVEASTRGERLTWDLVMEHAGPPPPPPDVAVEELPVDAAFWSGHRASLPSFDVTDEAVIAQIQALEHDVMLPLGRRWFGVRSRGAPVALAALLVLEGVGYLDHVVTLPEARRRGFAGATTIAALTAAAEAGAERTYLLAEPEGTARPLYERIGFRPVTQIASWLADREAPAGP